MAAPYWSDGQATLYLSDCRDVLAGMEAASVDAIATDPPYELAFMGRQWDASGIAYDPAVWRGCLRVLKPGGHLLAFGGTRTYHRLACAVEDAGFEIRDSIHWIYGSGFPKSLDVSKAIDKAAGAEREVLRTEDSRSDYDGRERKTVSVNVGWRAAENRSGTRDGSTRIVTAAATEDAARWEGWGTALKPAHEPIVVARKPLAGTVAANVLEHGTGALNIDGCRVEGSWGSMAARNGGGRSGGIMGESRGREATEAHDAGRWPPNVVLGPEAAAELDRQSGVLTSGANPLRRGSDKFRDAYGEFTGQPECTPHRGANSGGASRFFPVFRYEAKAPASERPRLPDGTAHPTVKPVALMRWLVRLVTPPGGLVLDPFAGSGTTAEAALLEGFRAVCIEADERYCEMAVLRLSQGVLTAVTA